MKDDAERLQVAQWILERNLGWIAAAEVKIGVVVAIDTAMLGALAAVFSALQPAQHSFLAILLSLSAALQLCGAVYCCAMALLPRVTGPASSYIFFGRVAARRATDYDEAFRRASAGELLGDCLAQVHRNAEIARDKFKWVRAGMGWSFSAIPTWVLSVSLLG